jgi:hypothetical protein
MCVLPPIVIIAFICAIVNGEGKAKLLNIFDARIYHHFNRLAFECFP